MADKDEIEVALEDDAVVVDLPAEGEGADAGETKEKKPRVRLQEPEDDNDEQGSAVTEATKALQEAKAAKEEAERKVAAAQATAASERQRREAAERQANQRGREADAARAEAETAQLTLLDRGIQGAKGEVEAYTGQLANAFESGDFKLAADIQAKLGQASAKLDRLEAQKEDVATRRPAAPEITEGRVEAPQGSPIDQYLASFAPEAQNWLRQHPECLPPSVGGTTAANAKMMKGHYAAIEQNITPNTVDYFRVIEEYTGHREPTSAAGATKKAGEEADPAARKASTQRAQPSAPPSRDVPVAGRQPARKGSVTLSKDQQDTAKMSFPHLPEREAFAQYARNLVELEAEGKIGRTTH